MGIELAALQERIANTASGAITAIRAVYVPIDDFTNPAVVAGFDAIAPQALPRA